MIGWNPRPFIFVHIPKCAGTSIELACIPLASAFTDLNSMPDEDRTRHWLPSSRGRQHAKLSRYERHYPLPDYFKFAFVRNPWDRAISQIAYLRRTGAVPEFASSNLKKHLRIYCQTSRQVASQDLAACQLDYLLDKTGKVSVDFIGRFESLAGDFGKICRELGADPPPGLPHVLDSHRPQHYSAYYDEQSIEWVRGRFIRDIEYFGYQFDQVAPATDPPPQKNTARGRPAPATAKH
jgi:hypothetical protein